MIAHRARKAEKKKSRNVWRLGTWNVRRRFAACGLYIYSGSHPGGGIESTVNLSANKWCPALRVLSLNHVGVFIPWGNSYWLGLWAVAWVWVSTWRNSIAATAAELAPSKEGHMTQWAVDRQDRTGCVCVCVCELLHHCYLSVKDCRVTTKQQ